jgi:hypothetical protein
MLTNVLPRVLRARQNYYEYDIDTTVNATGLYPLHTRAYLGILSNVALISSDRRYDLPLLSEELEHDLDSPRGSRAGFILKRNTLQLKPLAAVGYPTLRVTILLRPGTFVAESAAAQITAISGKTLSFADTTIPSTWTTSNTFDLIQGSAHYDHLGIDLSATTVDVAGDSIVMTDTPNSRLAVGDWVALAEESPVIQCPETFAYLLSQRVSNTCMRSMADRAGAEAGEKLVAEMEKSLTDTIQPRVQKEAQKIVNRTGMLRKSNSTRTDL